MKKLFTLIFAMMLSLCVKAQCGVTVAPDFTAVDCHGEEIHLYEILDRGQYVLIDFFFRNCGPCQQACPKVVEAYYALGCNQHDVFFIEISPSDNNDICQWWAEEYGVEYPTIGTNGGGEQIDNSFLIGQYPTVILIAPNRDVVISDLWPINSAQTVIDALADFGIEEHSCDETPEANPSVEIALGEVTTSTVEATFTPNSDCSSYHILMDVASNMEMWANMMGMSIEDLIVSWGIEKTETYTHTWTEQVPNTEYTVYALPKDADGNAGELVTTTVTTESMGGTGVSIIDLEVIVINDSTVRTIATPNAETASYHYGLMEKSYFDSIGESAAIQYFREDPYVFYEVDDWTWSPLTTNTEFVAIATGQNANGEWGETTIVEFKTNTDGCAELSRVDFNIYPNPAKDFVKLSAVSYQPSVVKIYNVMGMLVEEIEMSSKEIEINVSNWDKGVYLININGKVEKLIVK